MWLVREGNVLAVAESPSSRRGRVRGLLGLDGYEGALVLRPCRSVHTVRMRFTIDVAFCEDSGVVLKTLKMKPWRVSPLVWKASFVIEAEAGSFARWNLRVGDRIEVLP